MQKADGGWRHDSRTRYGRFRPLWALLWLLLAALWALQGCEWREITPEEAKQETATTAARKPSASAAGLVAVKVPVAPTLDGQGTEDAWTKATAYTVPLQGYSGDRMTMKAVYTDTDIYFLLSWSDYSHSIRQAGSWGRVHVGAQFGKLPTEAVDKWERFGVEDTLSVVWNIDAPDLAQEDFLNHAHAPDVKTRSGRMDRWLWAAGSTDPVHKLLDQHIDAQGLHDDSGTSFMIPNVADQDDPSTSINERSYPAFMPRFDLTQRKIPKLFIVKGEKPVLLYYRSEVEPFDLALVDREATLPGVIFADASSGSVTDVTVRSSHSTEAEAWTLEIQRPLTTSTPEQDVQFDHLAKTYAFVIGVFDNTDVDGSFSQVQQLTFAK